jgi:hypothetical protein
MCGVLGRASEVLGKGCQLPVERVGTGTEVRFQIEEKIEREPNGKFHLARTSVRSPEVVTRSSGQR